jgi:hypothetical protein
LTPAARAGAAALMVAALTLAPAPARAEAPRDPGARASVAEVAPESTPSLTPPAPPSPPPAPAPPAPGAANAAASPWQVPHYDKGFVLVSTPDPSQVPFMLRLNHVSQFRYTNSTDVNPTFTDHLGNVHDVLRRNDIQLTRDVFYFSGYVFDRRLDYNILVYTSSATLSATAAGYVGYVFNKAFALRVGFFSLPSVRSLTGNYPFFPGIDRNMAENYMRPGFTQGIWANGEPLPGFNYIAMLGNSLNTLDISANKIDQFFAGAASIWYDHNNFGKEYRDWEGHDKLALRVGTAFTFAREDRLSDLTTSSPENNATYISDGTLLFGTGTLAPGVTVSLANFYLYAADAGLKYKGLSFNTEFYFRWLNNFTADGALPLSHMFDWGFGASLGYFVLPRRLELYARGSYVNGPFRIAAEGAPGFNWYPFDTRQVWLGFEIIVIRNCPYQSVLYPYSAGQTGLVFPAQFLLRF